MVFVYVYQIIIGKGLQKCLGSLSHVIRQTRACIKDEYIEIDEILNQTMG